MNINNSAALGAVFDAIIRARNALQSKRHNHPERHPY